MTYIHLSVSIFGYIRFIKWGLILALLSVGLVASVQAVERQQPDVVFIIVDDLNDWIGCLDGHPNARSPHIDLLADSGMLFTQAYCNSPQCNPSRTSLNYGIYGFNSGIYFNSGNKVEPQFTTPSIQQFFGANGYRVASGGKVHHGGPGDFGDALLKRPRDPKPPKGDDKFSAKNPPNDGYALDVKDEEMGDYKVAQWAIGEWNVRSEKPLFMSVGFYRPHRPLQVPKSYFDLFPVESIQRPEEPVEDDWNDLPEIAKRLARSHAHKGFHGGLSDHEFIVTNDEWDVTIQAYHASIAFVDQQIGDLLKALEINPRGRETVVMLVSDHGWHLGEKKHWCKAALWEQTTRIPFIVRAPGVTPGSLCSQPVSLIDVFPTLVDLAGIQTPAHLDGASILPQLTEPATKRDPVISSYGEGNTAIRTERWRYIRYEDGSEELYDHKVDKNEWRNLAENPEFTEVKTRLAEFIPHDQQPSVKIQDWFDKADSAAPKAEAARSKIKNASSNSEDVGSKEKDRFSRRDKNKDGKVSYQEFIVSPKRDSMKKKSQFESKDADGDGYLTLEEFAK